MYKTLAHTHYLIKAFLLLALGIATISPFQAQVSSNNAGTYIVEHDRMGQINIVLVSQMSGSDISIKGGKDRELWFYTKSKDQATKLQVLSEADGNFHLLSPQEGGYLVKYAGNIEAAYWLTDYSKYSIPTSISATDSEGNICSLVSLVWDKDIESINYRTPAGLNKSIKRKISFTYPSLEWNEDLKRFDNKEMEEQKEVSGNQVTLTQSLLDASYTLHTDLYGEKLGLKYSPTTSNPYPSRRLEVHAYMVVHSDNAPQPKIKSMRAKTEPDSDDNQQEIDFGDVSAPLEVDFIAIGNDPVAAIYTWTIFPSNNPEEILVKYSGANFTHTFREAGKYTITLEVSNRDGSCSDYPFEDHVVIKESFIDIPNAFSPNASPGINDIFKVKYKSLVKFEAYIYDRYGNQLFHWDDPASGWDGKYKGKYVSPGVYFYLIKAKGADGIDYLKKGDINIVGYDGNDTSQEGNPPTQQ